MKKYLKAGEYIAVNTTEQQWSSFVNKMYFLCILLHKSSGAQK